MKAQNQFKVGDKVRIKFPIEVLPEGTEIHSDNCGFLFAREGLNNPGWTEEMSDWVENSHEGFITDVSTGIKGYSYGYYVDDSFYFSASCLELVESDTPFKKGDIVIHKKSKNDSDRCTVEQVLKDVDTGEVIICIDGVFYASATDYELYDPKEARKNALKAEIKALQDELDNL